MTDSKYFTLDLAIWENTSAAILFKNDLVVLILALNEE